MGLLQFLLRHTDYSHSYSGTKTTPILTQIYRILSFIDNSQTTPIYIQTTLIVTQTSPNLTQTYRLLPFLLKQSLILTHTHRLLPILTQDTQTTAILTHTYKLLPFSPETHQLPPFLLWTQADLTYIIMK